MTAPRLEINLDKIFHNASTLVGRLNSHGIAVTGVTKACLGNPSYAATLLAAGVGMLGDSRIENIEEMRRAGITAPIALIRTPMLSQAGLVVANADLSLNTELDVISALSDAAQKAGRRHAILLVVELGDLREGIMPDDLEETVRRTLTYSHIDLRGIAASLGCFNGVIPDGINMGELSRLADDLDQKFCASSNMVTPTVSGGNSSNLKWALSGINIGRINELRLGESILMGIDPLYREPIEGLFTDAVTLFAEVIESKIKPSQPWGEMAHPTFEQTTKKRHHHRTANHMVLAIGHQDIDPAGLSALNGSEILGASSDHLIVTTNGRRAPVGTEFAFALNYSALLRAMTSPFVRKDFLARQSLGPQSSETVPRAE